MKGNGGERIVGRIISLKSIFGDYQVPMFICLTGLTSPPFSLHSELAHMVQEN